MQGFSLTAVSNIVVTYTVDSYLPIAGEAMVCHFCAERIYWSGLGAVEFGLDRGGGRERGVWTNGGNSVFCVNVGVVFLVWGKRIRAMTERYGPTAWNGYDR
jgi:hypothetical protein